MLLDLPINENVNRSIGVSSEKLGQQSKATQKGKDLNKKPLSNAEIKVLEKEFDYGPIQNKISESKLRRDSEKTLLTNGT